MHTIDGLHIFAYILLGLTLAHGVLAIAEHYMPQAEPTLALRFIIGGGG